jgi:hypothetical protein
MSNEEITNLLIECNEKGYITRTKSDTVEYFKLVDFCLVNDLVAPYRAGDYHLTPIGSEIANSGLTYTDYIYRKKDRNELIQEILYELFQESSSGKHNPKKIIDIDIKTINDITAILIKRNLIETNALGYLSLSSLGHQFIDSGLDFKDWNISRSTSHSPANHIYLQGSNNNSIDILSNNSKKEISTTNNNQVQQIEKKWYTKILNWILQNIVLVGATTIIFGLILAYLIKKYCLN